MALNGDGCQVGQGVVNGLTVSAYRRGSKVPFLSPKHFEVLVYHPSFPFSGMPPPAPLEEGLPDVMVEGREDLRTVNMPVVIGPSSENWVEVSDDNCRLMRGVGSQPVPDALEEIFHLLFRWGNQAFTFELSDIKSEEVETLFDMNNFRLFSIECQPPLL